MPYGGWAIHKVNALEGARTLRPADGVSGLGREHLTGLSILLNAAPNKSNSTRYPHTRREERRNDHVPQDTLGVNTHVCVRLNDPFLSPFPFFGSQAVHDLTMPWPHLPCTLRGWVEPSGLRVAQGALWDRRTRTAASAEWRRDQGEPPLHNERND